MPASRPVLALYGDMFINDDSALDYLMNSGFTTANLWSIHVYPNGDLYHGPKLWVHDGVINAGTKPGQINPNLPEDIRKLRAGPNGFLSILGSIGAGGPPTPQDWAHIQSCLGTSSGR